MPRWATSTGHRVSGSGYMTNSLKLLASQLSEQALYPKPNWKPMENGLRQNGENIAPLRKARDLGFLGLRSW